MRRQRVSNRTATGSIRIHGKEMDRKDCLMVSYGRIQKTENEEDWI